MCYSANDVEVLLCCGCCGVLADIPAGDVIIPTRALRGEGASYQYLPPGRYVELHQQPIQIFKDVLEECKISYMECTTWSTDCFYRETKDMVAQLLYSGDILVGTQDYDDRNWFSNKSARERLFQITVKALIRFSEADKISEE